MRPLNEAKKLLSQLRQKGKFKEFESRLKQQGKRLAESLMQAAVDETQKRVLIGLVLEGSSGKVFDYALMMAARPQGTDDWELLGDEEPQARGCQAVQATAASATPLYVGDVSSLPTIGYYDSKRSVCLYGGTYSCVDVEVPTLSVNPTQIDFGVLLVGWSREQGITVKNNRLVTQTVTVRTSAPFWLVSGSSLVASLSFSLGVGQSREVKVRFSPTTAGTFQGNVNITSDGASFTIAVSGTGLTFEEFLARFYNTVAAEKGPSTLYYPYKEGKALMVHGFGQLSESLIKELVNISETISAEQLLQKNRELLERSIAEAQAMPSWEAIKRAIEYLARFWNDPAAYERALQWLKDNDPAFKQFWELLEKGACRGKICFGRLGPQKAREIIDTLAWLASKPELWSEFTRTIEKAMRALAALGLTEVDKIGITTLLGLASVFKALAERSAWDAISFGYLLTQTIDLILGCRDCSDDEKKNLTLQLLGKAFATMIPTWLGGETVDAYVFDVKVINAFLNHGWRPLEINKNVGGVHVDLVARIYSPELGRTITAYINAYDKFDPGRIAQEMKRITEYIKEQNIPDGVAVAVIGEPTSHDAIKTTADSHYTPGAPVVYIYQGSDGQWYWYSNCKTDEECRKAAAVAAQSPYNPKPSPLMGSGSSGSGTGSSGNTDEDESAFLCITPCPI